MIAVGVPIGLAGVADNLRSAWGLGGSCPGKVPEVADIGRRWLGADSSIPTLFMSRPSQSRDRIDCFGAELVPMRQSR
jgi:hypothetical protein